MLRYLHAIGLKFNQLTSANPNTVDQDQNDGSKAFKMFSAQVCKHFASIYQQFALQEVGGEQALLITSELVTMLSLLLRGHT